MQPHRQLLGEGELAQRDVAVDWIALPFAHHEIFAKHALHMRKEARAAEELHVRAQLLTTFATIVAPAARVRRAYGDFVTGLDARDAGAHGRDDRGCLVAGNQWLPHDEAAVLALEVVMQIGATDSAGAELQ